MSFTKDELQALHSILEQRLSLHRRELERSLDQRMNGLRRDFEQRMLATQQELTRLFAQRLSEQQTKLANILSYRLDTQQTHLVDEITRNVVQKQQQQSQQFESFVENVLAAQLLAMEQLLRQNLPFVSDDVQTDLLGDEQAEEIEDLGDRGEIGGIEVETDISWEDLADVMGKALDDRLSSLNESLQGSIRTIEQHLSARFYELREEVLRRKALSYNGTLHNAQDVLSSIEELERMIESMQVAMTSNHALLSRRISNHQQLPPERAHPSSTSGTPQETFASAHNTSLHTDEGNRKE